MARPSAAAANVKQAVPFFMVANMENSLQFYLDGFGFRMSNKWIDEGKLRWCWLELGAAALMLQEWSAADVKHGRPGSKVGVGVTVYFICDDALSMYRAMIERGLEARRPFVGNRMWVTSVTDPDGYNIDFESPTDVPEETE